MDIQVTSTGKIFYGVDPLLGGILLEAFPEAFRRAADKPAAPPIQKRLPTFVVNVNQSSDLPQIQFTRATGETVVYPGPGCATKYGNVEEARAAFARMGFPLPNDVAEQFESAVRAAIERNQAKRVAHESGYRG